MIDVVAKLKLLWYHYKPTEPKVGLVNGKAGKMAILMQGATMVPDTWGRRGRKRRRHANRTAPVQPTVLTIPEKACDLRKGNSVLATDGSVVTFVGFVVRPGFVRDTLPRDFDYRTQIEVVLRRPDGVEYNQRTLPLDTWQVVPQASTP